MSFWGRYVSVAERRAKAIREMNKLQKKGKDIQPVEIEGLTIARSFWGKGWCKHLESFSDYENRLPRGRAYVRNGSVCHLEIKPGRIEAFVSGSSLYQVAINIKKLKTADWKSIQKKCSGQIGSMLELLQGKLSDEVMAIVSDRKNGLFPQPGEIDLKCNCPDWATMCKHVAAVLYGVGSRLDERPELLFILRDVDAAELISAEMTLPGVGVGASGDALSDDLLGDIFDIDLDTGEELDARPAPKTKPQKQQTVQKRTVQKRPVQKRAVSPGIRKSARAAKDGKTLAPSAGDKKTAKKRPPKKTARVVGIGKRAQVKTPDVAPNIALPRIRPSGKSVARLRKDLGFSPAQFAKELGVSPASVYNWEATQGRLTLQARSLNALAELTLKAKKQ